MWLSHSENAAQERPGTPGPWGASGRWWSGSRSGCLRRLMRPHARRTCARRSGGRCGLWAGAGTGVLDRGSGLRFWAFSASNLLRSGATHQPVLWGLNVLIGKEGQARPHDTGVHSERERRRHTSSARQTCRRMKYFGSGDANNGSYFCFFF